MTEKNILVIGNGFDIAHKLPTRYTDFLEFVNLIKEYKIENGEIFPEKHKFFSKKTIDSFYNHHESKTREFLDNIWYKYFVEIRKQHFTGENWIDFENEMSYIIKHLDLLSCDLTETINYKWDEISEMSNTLPKLFIFFKLVTDEIRANRKSSKRCYTFNTLRNYLIDYLDFFINFFELYLSHVVENMNPTPLAMFNHINADLVISFNYTHTYYKLYPETLIQYVHGETRTSTETHKDNNMVFGIDEYWDDDRKNTATNYVIFKKYVQRIQKDADLNIEKKIDDLIRRDEKIDNLGSISNATNQINIHIYGHSIDPTDKEILLPLFNLDNDYKYKQRATVINVIVYHLDRATQGEYIANLVKILKKDILLKRVRDKTLHFHHIER